jgi:hypothetical protein
LQSKSYLEPLLWLSHSESSEVVAIVGVVRPLCEEVSKGSYRLRDSFRIAALLLEHAFHLTTTPLQSILEPGHVVNETQVVLELSRLHQLACGLSERDVKRRCSTSNGTSDVAGEAEQLGTCLGPTGFSH